MITKKISIDDMPPVEALAEIARFDQDKRAYRRFFKAKAPVIHVSRSYGDSDDPGIKATRLMDWRALERRAHELRAPEHAHYEALFSALRDAWKECARRKGKQVWVPEPGNSQRVMTYDGHGQSFDDADNLIKEGISDPDLKAYIIKGDDAKSVWRDHNRHRQFMERRGHYTRAFMHAVEMRLKPFVNKQLRCKAFPNTYYFVASIFLINNDDRQYVVCSDERSQLVWRDDDIYECT